LYRFARDEEIDLDELRARLRKMTDDDLLRFGKAARFMCRDKVPRQSTPTGVRHSARRSAGRMATAASQAALLALEQQPHGADRQDQRQISFRHLLRFRPPNVWQLPLPLQRGHAISAGNSPKDLSEGIFPWP
jgi:hypothetical protein